MLPIELILIRHGQSELNAGTSEDLNCGLTAIGRSQASAVGRQLAELSLEGFRGIVSPYRRAVETAAEVSRETGIRFNTDERIREWGRSVTVDGKLYKHEPIEAVVARLRTFLAERAGQRLIIVSHGAPIALLSDLADGQAPSTRGQFWLSVENCCLRRHSIRHD